MADTKELAYFAGFFDGEKRELGATEVIDFAAARLKVLKRGEAA